LSPITYYDDCGKPGSCDRGGGQKRSTENPSWQGHQLLL
jgi:hypothetical protein